MRRRVTTTKEQLEALLDPPGSISSAARTLGIAHTTVRAMIDELGIDYESHANSLGPSAISFGWSGEEHAAVVLGATLNRRTGSPGAEPFDLFWRDQRIDVKTAHPTLSGNSPTWGWSFAVGSGRGRCDLFFCIACAENGLPVRYMLIPETDVVVSTIRVPTNLQGKWMRRYEWRPS